MDIFAHFLWTFAMYWKHPKRFIAGLIGFFPDMLSFGALFIINLFSGTITRGPIAHDALPQWIFTMYNVGHSFVVYAVVFAIVWWIKREWAWLTFGWPLHILIDIPTHTTKFFATPFLWPLSDVAFNGISWGTGWFMAVNYSAIVCVYAWLIWRVPGPAKTVKL